MQKKRRTIKKMRIYETSLAKNPANGFGFIIKKEQGGMNMDKFAQLMAVLAQKADVPEVVKEELKDFLPENMEEFNAEEILKEIGIEIEPKVIEKEVPVDRVKVGDSEVEVDKLIKDFETMHGKVKVLEKEVERLEKENIKKELYGRVNKETADELFEKYYGKLSKDELFELADKFAGFEKLAKDVRGVSGEPNEGIQITKMIEDKISEIMKEQGVSRSEAIVILGESEPDLIKAWK